MSNKLKDLNPKFWEYATHAKKPSKNELYNTDYLENHIKRALRTRIHEPFYESLHISNILNITDLKEFENIEKAIRTLPNFSKYDRETDHNDVSAALGLYRRFLQFINKQSTFLEKDEESEKEQTNDDFEITNLPEEKPKPHQKNGQKYWVRNFKKCEKAIELSAFKCELDNSHYTFINRRTGKQYTEAHHLIPMSAQNDFKYSLDILENIVSLCPNCHRMLHHGENIDVILKKLFDSRKQSLLKKGIDITFEKLMTYYLG